MKKTLFLTLSILCASTAQADPAIMFGLSYSFNGEFGVTVKALSNDDEDEFVAAVGATFYPYTNKSFGLDAGIGYTFDDAAAVLSWDFLQEAAQASIGYANTDSNKSSSPVTTPAPAPGA
ncbi:MAG: hypothetical protein ACKVJE_17410 [Pseudomonadales bacterium]